MDTTYRITIEIVKPILGVIRETYKTKENRVYNLGEGRIAKDANREVEVINIKIKVGVTLKLRETIIVDESYLHGEEVVEELRKRKTLINNGIQYTIIEDNREEFEHGVKIIYLTIREQNENIEEIIMDKKEIEEFENDILKEDSLNGKMINTLLSQKAQIRDELRCERSSNNRYFNMNEEATEEIKTLKRQKRILIVLASITSFASVIFSFI